MQDGNIYPGPKAISARPTGLLFGLNRRMVAFLVPSEFDCLYSLQPFVAQTAQTLPLEPGCAKTGNKGIEFDRLGQQGVVTVGNSEENILRHSDKFSSTPFQVTPAGVFPHQPTNPALSESEKR